MIEDSLTMREVASAGIHVPLDNCSSLFDCFSGNLLPAILLILGLLLILTAPWWAAGLVGRFALSGAIRALARILTRSGGRVSARAAARSAKRAVRSLRKRAAEHRKKLADYRRNPDRYDNKDFLKNAPSKEVRDRIIDRRIKHLESEIKNFEKQIENLRREFGL